MFPAHICNVCERELNDSLESVTCMRCIHAGKRWWSKNFYWTVKVIRGGLDKSDYHVVKVKEEPGYTGEYCTQSTQQFKRTHPVFYYREYARQLKAQLVRGLPCKHRWD